MAETKHTLPDGKEIRTYDHGGLDARDFEDGWFSVATTPEACAALGRIAWQTAGADPVILAWAAYETAQRMADTLAERGHTGHRVAANEIMSAAWDRFIDALDERWREIDARMRDE